MAIAGETITHPVNGERVTFIRTSADTDGALAELEFDLPAGMIPCPEHVHPQSTETITVHSGALRVMIDGRLQDVAAGETIELPPGRPHTYVAVGDVRLTAVYAPAMRMDGEVIKVCWKVAASGASSGSVSMPPCSIRSMAKAAMFCSLVPLTSLPIEDSGPGVSPRERAVMVRK